MDRTPRVQAKIKTSGVSKTTPGLGRSKSDVKTPVQIHNRLWRDPKSVDLTDIERAADLAKAQVKHLSELAKQEIAEKKEQSEKQKIQAAVDLALKEVNDAIKEVKKS